MNVLSKPVDSQLPPINKEKGEASPAISAIRSPILDNLIEECLRKPSQDRQLVVNPGLRIRITIPIEHQLKEYLGYLSLIPYEKKYLSLVNNFKEQGGELRFLGSHPIEERWEDEAIAIQPSDEMISVCQMGLVRSPLLYLVAKAFKWTIGCSIGQENVRAPHGTLGGYDPATAGKIESNSNMTRVIARAFGIMMPSRFGEIEIKETKSHKRLHETESPKSNPLNRTEFFNLNYYKHQSTQANRKIFVACWETGFTVIQRLLEANLIGKNESNSSSNSLKGVTIVFIPETDWISRCSIFNDIRDKLSELCIKHLKHAFKTPFPVLTLKEKREMFSWMVELKPRPKNWAGLLTAFVPNVLEESEGKEPTAQDIINAVKIEACRAAFWRYSSLFKQS